MPHRSALPHEQGAARRFPSRWLLGGLCMAASAFILAAVQEPGMPAPPPVMDVPNPIVISNGTATIFVPPATVQFTMRYETTGATFEEAMGATEKFRDQVRAAFDEKQLKPIDLTFSGPSLTDINLKRIQITVQCVFPMAPYARQDTGPMEFAKFCDTMVALAKTLGLPIEGPLFKAEDENSTADSAVNTAAENAYAPAAAAATALHSAIASVDSIEIQSIEWNTKPGAPEPAPSLREIACQAKVKVTYLLNPQP